MWIPSPLCADGIQQIHMQRHTSYEERHCEAHGRKTTGADVNLIQVGRTALHGYRGIDLPIGIGI